MEWYVYRLNPAMKSIAAPGWLERHLADVLLLLRSPHLADCCRATVAELFGLPAFHVAVQTFPVSDGLVRNLCHQGGDRREAARRMAGQLTYFSTAFGRYPPPGVDCPRGHDVCMANMGPVFDAIPCR